MITRDPVTLCRFLGIEFPEDLGQVVSTLAPPLPTRRPVEHQDVYRWGITFDRASERRRNAPTAMAR